MIATFYNNGAEFSRGRLGAPVDDVTTYSLTILTPLAANDVIEVRVSFATNEGYIESDQVTFLGLLYTMILIDSGPNERRIALAVTHGTKATTAEHPSRPTWCSASTS